MSTELKIRRIGGSFMLHLTADVARAMGAHAGQSILATQDGDRWVLDPRAAPRRRQTYEELLAKCDLSAPPDPFEEQWMSFPAVGEEIVRDH